MAAPVQAIHITCLHCGTEVPTEVAEARFCVSCGRPLMQPCPYEGVGSTRLPLRASTGRPPARCPACAGFLAACQSCGRLHTLREPRCLTCGGEVREPSGASPTALGPTSGTHCLSWPGLFGTRLQALPEPLRIEEPVAALAYRYGLLVVATPRNLLAFTRHGDGWARVGLAPLAATGVLRVREMIVDDGQAFILAEDRALAVALSDFTISAAMPGRFSAQAVDEHCWVLVGDDGHVSVTDCRIWDTRELALDGPAPAVAAATIADGRLLLALREGRLVALSLADGAVDGWSSSLVRVTRLALAGDTLLLLGYDTDGICRLVGMTAQHGIDGNPMLTAGVAPDFAWHGDQVYMASNTGLATFSRMNLTQGPKAVGLAHGLETLEGLLVLEDVAGARRVLLHRRDQAGAVLLLVDPATGAPLPVGESFPTPPQACVADAALVVAAQEGGRSVLTTYCFPEGMP